MRSRVFDDKTTSSDYPFIYKDAGKVLSDNRILYTASRNFARMDDVVTPLYHALSMRGMLIQSPKSKEVVRFTQKASLFKAKCYQSIDHRLREVETGSIARVGLTIPPILITDTQAWWAAFDSFSQEIDLAITRAHANVSVSEMQLLATIGELPETVAWLSSLIQRLVKMTKAMRQKKEMVNVFRTLTYDLQEATHPKGAKFAARRLDLYKQLLEKRKVNKLPSDLIGGAATAWLEYRYAIRPLLGDIANAIKVIKANLPYGKRQTARGKELRVYDDVSFQNDDPSPVDRILVEDLRVQRAGSVKASCGVLFAIERNLDALSALLGVDQPWSSAYELIPYSFIVDWVANIGEWLQSLTKSSGLSTLSSWVTLTYKESVKVTPTNARMRYMPSDTHQWEMTSYTAGGSASVVERVWRVPNPSIPLLPSFDLKLNISKILDLGFIFRQVLSGDVNPVVKRS